MEAANDIETPARFGALCTRLEAPGVYARTIVSVTYLLSEFSEADAKAKAREHLCRQGWHAMSILPWTHPAMRALNVKDEFFSVRKTDSNGTGLPPLWPRDSQPPFPRSTSPEGP